MNGQTRLRNLLPFLVVGAVGFAIEAALLTGLVVMRHWQPLAARAISFPVAVTICWWLNRNWTFANARHVSAGRQYVFFFAVQCVGALINLCVFWYMMHWWPASRSWPIVPLAAGSVVALSFNFFASAKLVFSNIRNEKAI